MSKFADVVSGILRDVLDESHPGQMYRVNLTALGKSGVAGDELVIALLKTLDCQDKDVVLDEAGTKARLPVGQTTGGKQFILVRAQDTPARERSNAFVTPHFAAKLRDSRLDQASGICNFLLVVFIDHVLDTVRASQELTDSGERLDASTLIDIIAENSTSTEFRNFVRAAREDLVTAAVRGRIDQRGQVMETLSQLALESTPDIGAALPKLGTFVKDSNLGDYLAGSTSALAARLKAGREAAAVIRTAREGKTDPYTALEGHVREEKIKTWVGKREDEVDLKDWQRDEQKTTGPPKTRFDRFRYKPQGVIAGDQGDRGDQAKELDLLITNPEQVGIGAVYAEWPDRPQIVLESNGRVIYKGPAEAAPPEYILSEAKSVALKVPKATNAWQFFELRIYAGKATTRGTANRTLRVARAPAGSAAVYLPAFTVSIQQSAIRVRPGPEFIVAESKEAHKRAARGKELPTALDPRAPIPLPCRLISGPQDPTSWTFETGEAKIELPLICDAVEEQVEQGSEVAFYSALHNLAMEGTGPRLWKYLPQARALEAEGKARTLAVHINAELALEHEIVTRAINFPAFGPGRQLLEGSIPAFVRTVQSFSKVIDAYRNLFYWLRTNETLPSLVGHDSDYQRLVTEVLEAAKSCMEDDETDPATLASLWRFGAIVDKNNDVELTTPLWLPTLAYWSQFAKLNLRGGLKKERQAFLNPSVLAPVTIRGSTNPGLRALPEPSVTGLWLKWRNAQELGDAEIPRAGDILRDRLKEFVKAFPHLVGYHENAPLLVNFIGVTPNQDLADGLMEFFRWHLNRVTKPDYNGPAFDIRLKLEFYVEDPTVITEFDQRMAPDKAEGIDEFEFDPVHRFVQYAKRSSVRVDTQPRYAHLTFIARGFKHMPADDDSKTLLPNGRVGGIVSTSALDLPVLAEKKPDRIGFGIKGLVKLQDEQQFALAFNEMQAALAQGLTYPQRTPFKVPCVVAQPKTFAALRDIYERSVWVVHLEPGVSLIPLKYDKQHESVLIHFTDQKNATRSGFDEVTLTKHKQAFDQCLEGIYRELHLVRPEGLLPLLNSVNPTWALQLFSTTSMRRTEKIACAIAAKTVRDRAQEEAPKWTWLVSGWEDFHRVTGSTGLVKGEGGMASDKGSDDVILFGVNPEEPGTLRILIVEVKYGRSGEPRGIEQIKEAWTTLRERTQAPGFAGKMFRSELGQYVSRAAERMFVHGQLTTTQLTVVSKCCQPFIDGLLDLEHSAGDGLPSLGIVVRVDPDAAETSRRQAEPGIEVERIPWARHAEFAREVSEALDVQAPAKEVQKAAPSREVQKAGPTPSSSHPESKVEPPSRPSPTTAAAPERKPAEPAAEAKAEPVVFANTWPKRVLSAVSAPAYATPKVDKKRFELIDESLRELGVDVEVPGNDDIVVGPQATAIHLRPKAGTRVSKLEQSLANVKLALGVTKDLSLSTYERAGHVTLFVPHDVKQPVPLTTCMDANEIESRTLPIPLGVTAENKTLWVDLVQTNHLLVAGSTGSGKTVFLQSLVLSLATALSPKQLQIRLVDPKQLDFALLEGLPHAWGEVVYEANDAQALLEEMLQEVRERQTKLRAEKCKNVLEYQQLHGRESLPHIVLVIDEYNQLLGSYETKQDRQQFEELVCQIAQIGRALGIYLVLATQRPSVDVVTGKIKANFPTRISFRLPSATDSRVILDEVGAESLQPGGDGLLVGLGGLRRFQAPYVDAQTLKEYIQAMNGANAT